MGDGLPSVPQHVYQESSVRFPPDEIMHGLEKKVPGAFRDWKKRESAIPFALTKTVGRLRIAP
jgi:hypothetical protein